MSIEAACHRHFVVVIGNRFRYCIVLKCHYSTQLSQLTARWLISFELENDLCLTSIRLIGKYRDDQNKRKMKDCRKNDPHRCCILRREVRIRVMFTL